MQRGKTFSISYDNNLSFVHHFSITTHTDKKTKYCCILKSNNPNFEVACFTGKNKNRFFWLNVLNQAVVPRLSIALWKCSTSQVYLISETHRTMDSPYEDEITDFEAVWIMKDTGCTMLLQKHWIPEYSALLNLSNITELISPLLFAEKVK